MHSFAQSRLSLRRRLGVLAASAAVGLAACGALLAALGGPALPAWAAPAGLTLIFPGSTPCDTTLQACLDGASTGDTIVVQPGTYITNALTLSTAVSLTGVSSATVILEALPNQRVLTVTGAAVNSSVVISGLTLAGGHAVGSGCPDACGGALLLDDSAQPRLINLILRDNQADGQGGALFANFGSPLSLTGAQILSNTSVGNGGAMNVNDTGVIRQALFQNNQCTNPNCGGGALTANTYFTLIGTRFVSSTAASGGALYLFDDADISDAVFQSSQCTLNSCSGGAVYANHALTLTNSQFLSNTSSGDGAGAFVFSTSTVSGGLFQNNQCFAASCGGAGLFANDYLALTGTRFVSNTSVGDGGAAQAYYDADLTNAVFQNNQCSGSNCNGGGLEVGGRAGLTNTQFVSNTADGMGGGAYVDADASLSATRFLSNTSGGRGGGLRVYGDARVSSGLFQNNQCTSISGCDGGGLQVNGSAALTNTQFVSNSATNGGGGAAVGVNASLAGGQFLSNTSDYEGGGLDVLGDADVRGGLFQNNRCTDLLGCTGGGAAVGGSASLTDTQFVSNSASTLGGGAWVVVNASLSNTRFLSNTSVFEGGGLDVLGDADVRGGLFQNNRCTDLGDCTGGGASVGGSLVLTGSQFLSNSSTSEGGGVFVYVDSTVTNTVFINNHSLDGGGLYQCEGGGVGLYVNNLFAGNQADGDGNAIYIGSPAGATLLFNTLAGPVAGGAAVYVANGTVVITDTLIASHTVGIETNGGSVLEGYNLFAGVSTPYSGDVTSAGHSLTGTAGFVNAAAGNFHLAAGSAALNAGVDVGIHVDFDGDARPLGAGFDIGYDEVLPVVATVFKLFLPLVRR